MEYCSKLKGSRPSKYCVAPGKPKLSKETITHPNELPQIENAETVFPNMEKSQSVKQAALKTPVTQAVTYYDPTSPHEWAKQAQVKNLGQDIKGAARHKRNEYRSWQDFESAISSNEAPLNKGVLMKHFSPDFDALISANENEPEKTFLMERALSKFPTKCPVASPSDLQSIRGAYARAFREISEETKNLIQNKEMSVDEAQVRLQDKIRSIENDIRNDPKITNGISLMYDLRRMREKIRKNFSSTSARQDLIVAQREIAYELEITTPEEVRQKVRYSNVGLPPDIHEKLKADPRYRSALQKRLGKSALKRAPATKSPTFKEQDWYKANVSYKIEGDSRGINTLEDATRFMIDEAQFKGIQFGNAMNDKERAEHLIAAAKSVKDLALVTGMSPKAITQGGKLGLAFGARGSGKAMATYSPAHKVVNLTRKSGYGSLAHELGHAFDNEIGIKLERKQRYGSEGWYTEVDTSPQAIAMEKAQRALSKVRSRIQASDKYRTLAPSTREYMTDRKEVFARCFESYVDSKLKKTGIVNTYLVEKPNNEFYPTPEELSELEPLFDGLIKTES